MEFDSIRPIFSGLLGAVIATWLTSKWLRSLPSHYRSKSREELVKDHRVAIASGNVLFLAGLVIGISLYKFGGFANTDWRPLGLGFGLASVLPLVAIASVSLASGRSVREAYVAFSWGQGTPSYVTYGILGAGVVAFVMSIASLAA